MDVTLFATGDSVTKAKLQSVCQTSLGEHPADAKVWECLRISNLMEQASQFDIIHNHFRLSSPHLFPVDPMPGYYHHSWFFFRRNCSGI